MKMFVVVSLLLAGSLSAQTTTGKHPFTFEDMMKLKRVGAPIPSPDGKWIVFDAVDVDLEANTRTSHLWIVPAAGGEARRLNQTPNAEERPRFSPDGKRVAFSSDRSFKGNYDIWVADLENGRLTQWTSGPADEFEPAWTPDGMRIAFVSGVGGNGTSVQSVDAAGRINPYSRRLMVRT
jgi:Tol biopolymer transport system component